MNKSILFVIFLWISSAAFSQNLNCEKSLDELNGFMNLHVSPGATSVTGYNLTLKGKVLDKETLLFDGKSHHKAFKLSKKAVIEIKYFDFTVPYWEVSIKGDWFHTELQTLEDAEKLVSILKELQSSL